MNEANNFQRVKCVLSGVDLRATQLNGLSVQYFPLTPRYPHLCRATNIFLCGSKTLEGNPYRKPLV